MPATEGLRAALLGSACVLLLLASSANAAEESATTPEDETAEAASDETPAEAEGETSQETLCDLIETAADDHDLPVGYFTRLIWRESRFRSDAVSPKGAQGIAQFMPGTASERSLADPFDVRLAIPASASYLADLSQRFGNLGLAAAAYNAGPKRVGNWLAESATLPLETQDYVLAITGLTAEAWADPDGEPALPPEPEDAKDCLALAALLKGGDAVLAPEIETAHAPWGVQVTGSYSRAKAVAAYMALAERFSDLVADRPPMIVAGRAPGRGTRAFYRVRVPAETRDEAETFCRKLRSAGGNCVVLKT